MKSDIHGPRATCSSPPAADRRPDPRLPERRSGLPGTPEGHPCDLAPGNGTDGRAPHKAPSRRRAPDWRGPCGQASTPAGAGTLPAFPRSRRVRNGGAPGSPRTRPGRRAQSGVRSGRRKSGGREPACKPGSVEGSHSSGTRVAARLVRPTRERRGPRLSLPYLVLLRVGFTLPPVLPPARCALTAPFHPCPRSAGGMFSVALSVGSRPPGVTWHPALRSPDFPPRREMRRSGCPADSRPASIRLAVPLRNREPGSEWNSAVLIRLAHGSPSFHSDPDFPAPPGA